MNYYLKKYLLRGLIFGSLGPLVLGIVYWVLDLTGTDLQLSGGQILLGIVTTYIIAFVHSAVSSLPQIESWSTVKAMFVQLISLYTVYAGGYLLNNWIPFDPMVLLIYSSIFIGGFFLIWITILISTHIVAKKLNKKLESKNKTE